MLPQVVLLSLVCQADGLDAVAADLPVALRGRLLRCLQPNQAVNIAAMRTCQTGSHVPRRVQSPVGGLEGLFQPNLTNGICSHGNC